MKTPRFIAIAAGLVLAVAAALVTLSPVAHGQARHDDGLPALRALDAVGGRGSRIGVGVRDVDDADAKREKLSGPAGAVIEEVRAETPAAAAGLRAGDVVVEFDGERVRSARQFSRLVEETPAGRTVTARVVRDGKANAVQVTPEASPGLLAGVEPRVWQRRRDRDPSGSAPSPDEFSLESFGFDGELPFMPSGDRARLGVGVQNLTRDLAQYFGVERGVLVNSVQPDSPAARAGIRPGDVITSVNDTAVGTSAELRRLVTAAKEETLSVGLTRDRKPLTVTATVPRPERSRPQPGSRTRA